SSAHGLQRGASQGRGRRHRPRRRDGEALFFTGVRARDVALRRAVRRLWLHPRLSGGEVLPGRQDRHDLRGHLKHAAPDDRQGAAQVGDKMRKLMLASAIAAFAVAPTLQAQIEQSEYQARRDRFAAELDSVTSGKDWVALVTGGEEPAQDYLAFIQKPRF